MTTLEHRSTGEHRGAPIVDHVTSRWLPVQRGAVAAIVLASLFIQVVMAGHVIPPLVAIPAVFLVAAGFSARRPRGSVIAVGVLGLLTLLLFLPDIFRDLSNPESAFTFVTTGVLTAALAVAAVSGALTIARRGTRRAPSLVPGVALLAVVVLAVTAVASRLTLESDAAQPGDLLVVAEEVWFVPDTLQAEAGTVAVHVENRDLGHHDFVIDELDVALDIAERSSRRIEFEAEPGTYQIVCTLPGHERMEIELTVT